MRVVEELSAKRLCFTVTSGRSGTKLLTAMLREVMGVCAHHEPAPRFNYVLRAILACPEAAAWWLSTEKLPAIAELARSHDTYAELSHLTCKGFIEPLINLGLRPCFLMISRPAREVASSLLKVGAVPERTGSGRLVLIGPQHSAFLPLSGWEQLSDYQLCYWYAREIERRQEHYRSFLSACGLDWRDCTLEDVTNWEAFKSVGAFVAGSPTEPNREKFDQLLSSNQNPRAAVLNGSPERELPPDLDSQERQVEALVEKSS